MSQPELYSSLAKSNSGSVRNAICSCDVSIWPDELFSRQSRRRAASPKSQRDTASGSLGDFPFLIQSCLTRAPPSRCGVLRRKVFQVRLSQQNPLGKSIGGLLSANPSDQHPWGDLS